MNAIVTVALKEFRDGLRNRWVLACTLIFALLAVGVAWFGSAAAGTTGWAGLATTIVSLASLAVFLVPLIALLLAYDSVVGEAEQGTLLLLLSYPLSRTQLLAGKFLGHGLILGVSSALGFGAAGLAVAILSNQWSWELWAALGRFVLSAWLLGLCFVALAYLVSVTAVEKARAAGLALIGWFLMVLVYDLALLGLLAGTQGGLRAEVFPYLLLLNPTDVFRLINLTGFEAARVQSGLVAVAAQGLFHPYLLLAILAAWSALPFTLAAWLFRRRAP